VAVASTEVDEKDLNYSIVKAVLTQGDLARFRTNFLQQSSLIHN
jgi:hypothetical protein